MKKMETFFLMQTSIIIQIFNDMKMSKFFTTIFMTLLCLNFISCSDDDEPKGFDRIDHKLPIEEGHFSCDSSYLYNAPEKAPNQFFKVDISDRDIFISNDTIRLETDIYDNCIRNGNDMIWHSEENQNWNYIFYFAITQSGKKVFIKDNSLMTSTQPRQLTYYYIR